MLIILLNVQITTKTIIITHVDLMVIHLSCSSFLVSVNLVSPAFAPAIIPALLTRESVRVDFPWSTWAMTDILRIFRFLSIMARISSTVKFTLKTTTKALQSHTISETYGLKEIINRAAWCCATFSYLLPLTRKCTWIRQTVNEVAYHYSE